MMPVKSIFNQIKPGLKYYIHQDNNNYDMYDYGNAKTAACEIKQVFEKSHANIRSPTINILLRCLQ